MSIVLMGDFLTSHCCWFLTVVSVPICYTTFHSTAHITHNNNPNMSLVSTNVPLVGTSVAVGGSPRRHRGHSPGTGTAAQGGTAILLLGSAEIHSRQRNIAESRLKIAYLKVPSSPTYTAELELKEASQTLPHRPSDPSGATTDITLIHFLTSFGLVEDGCTVVYIAGINGSMDYVPELTEALRELGIVQVFTLDPAKATFLRVGHGPEQPQTESETFDAIVFQWTDFLKAKGMSLQESLGRCAR